VQALAESKYFGEGDSSRMSDNEQASPSLRHSEVLRVKSSPGDAIPEFNKAGNDRKEVTSSVAGHEPRYIFPDNPCGAALSNDPVHSPPESATVANQAAALSCNAVILAGEATTDEIDRSESCSLSLVGGVSMPSKNAPDIGPRFPYDTVGAGWSLGRIRLRCPSDIFHILVKVHVGPVVS